MEYALGIDSAYLGTIDDGREDLAGQFKYTLGSSVDKLGNVIVIRPGTSANMHSPVSNTAVNAREQSEDKEGENKDF